MVDIENKTDTVRVARAEGTIKMRSESIALIKAGRVKKGDVFSNASLATINAVKKTSDLIFLAHPIPIMGVDTAFQVDEENSQVHVSVEVKSVGKTGVELEALTGVTIALLSIFDLLKYVEKDDEGQYPITRIDHIRVTHKRKEP